IKKKTDIDEIVLLSTCNRVELYANYEHDLKEIFDDFIMKNRAQNSNNYTYSYSQREAVEHLFGVSSGLDSAIIGEPQITNQLMNAYDIAYRNGCTSKFMNKLFQKSFRVTKLVRSKTSIGARSVSLAKIAFKLILRVFPSINDLTITVIGSGEIGQDMIRYFLLHHPKTINLITRRNDIIEDKVTVMSPEDKNYLLRGSDIIVAASYFDGRFISLEDLRINRKNCMMIFDVSMPKIVDPACSQLEDIYLYDLADLQKIASENLEKRKEELNFAYKIISSEIDGFIIDMKKSACRMCLTPCHDV
ncbi:MAG: hypothetical protein HY606_14690, partial [Planctomycetes bacterium]|nr:hypothetical protein [Planctomycetota bacterium]